MGADRSRERRPRAAAFIAATALFIVAIVPGMPPSLDAPAAERAARYATTQIAQLLSLSTKTVAN